ncbi:AAA family ATPase, partial [bacterium]|nr:AAA family ATPase [candidate division CSSED10-310 bacterium]
MIRAEYLRFLKTLKDEECHRDVYKIANLVLQYLDALIPLTTSKGQRVKKIVEIAQKNWSSLSQVIEAEDSITEKVPCPFKRVNNLTVGPFRGFEKQEDFRLSNQYVFVYGSNGTGKSSFCEALEYGLLGSVSEAENKRYRNQHDYLKNAYAGQFAIPKLAGIDNDGCEVDIIPDEALYRFCFIEKNRIDNFSRIAAQAPAKQTELISSLFGLDDFTEFVRNFTDNMIDRYIDLKGMKSTQLNEKMAALTGSKTQLNSIIPEELKLISEAKKSLASKYDPNYSYEKMLAELNGTDEEKGLINQLEEDLQKPIGTKSNLTVIIFN